MGAANLRSLLTIYVQDKNNTANAEGQDLVAAALSMYTTTGTQYLALFYRS